MLRCCDVEMRYRDVKMLRCLHVDMLGCGKARHVADLGKSQILASGKSWQVANPDKWRVPANGKS